ncbi:unnamed protein product [Blepharisma stoltei]|uniref:SANT domain-containing protein n=1 Tax=Blepharisma stoltei TaxID=1481888 RepID=A0AAU9K557_9CILI|nr:unnamed protein product [Blepharisma stoltei]
MEPDKTHKKETLRDIARSHSSTARSRKKPAPSKKIKHLLKDPINEEKTDIVEKLFKNARENIAKLEEEKQQSKPNKATPIAPQIKIENGKIVIDKEKLVDACAQSKIRHEDMEIVRETGNSLRSNKRLHSERWNPDETEMFYTALQLFGTDFELIANFMKKRTRNQIKSKFKKESKNNPGRVDHAIWNRINLTKEAYDDYIKTLKIESH